MTIKEAITQVAMADSDFPATVNIGFVNSIDGIHDETQMDPENIDDLVELWNEFCEENSFDPDTVTYAEFY